MGPPCTCDKAPIHLMEMTLMLTGRRGNQLLIRSRLLLTTDDIGKLHSIIMFGPRIEVEQAGALDAQPELKLLLCERKVGFHKTEQCQFASFSVQECKTNDFPSGSAPVINMHYSASYTHESFNH